MHKNGSVKENLCENVYKNRVNGEIRLEWEKVEHEGSNGVSIGNEALNDKNGFNEDLNSAQFPPINGMDDNKNGVNEGLKGCLDKESRCNSGGGNNDSADGNEAMNEENDNTINKNKGVGENEEGIKEVINNEPWMVNNKPMVVQKWSIDMCRDKVEPKKLPVWVKMMNVPMEAWSVKGISALASSIWKPLIMDEVTTKMCVTRVGRISFARVLFEIDDEKGIKDKIEIMYRSKDVAIGTKKIVDVEYSWIPSIYSHCKENVFKEVQNRRFGRKGFVMNRITKVQNGQKDKMWNEGRFGNVNNKWKQNNKFEYRIRRENEGKEKDVHGGIDKNSKINGISTNNEKTSDGKKETKDNQKVQEKGSTSKGSNNGEGILGSDREIEDNEDVLGENDDVENTVLRNEMKGAGICSYSDKQKEVKKLIQEEGLQFCAILETHVKFKNIKKTCEIVFGEWEYITNDEDNNKGCRIMIGWNNRKIQAWLISQLRQCIFLMVETIYKKSKFFCTVIYASNSGMKRKKLWKDLEIQKRITFGIPWVNLGDYNVTLNVSEHSNGSVNPFSEMAEFQDCVNEIEVKDLHSEGFHYTWIKSLKNPIKGAKITN
uniref:RNA-directed DNA polymerase, eukaryota, reverse transcriptase zinc-binding domain protein n=1 Tax=Tanacetum cinerariifolium TaxID=118510 RepID=A0A6L2JB35_TANCI|nr:RNA-directed DNA polymerase, eukaryota, reverse transcriptase zinc-binding domain protein [Tanacetum cinerariifolium]